MSNASDRFARWSTVIGIAIAIVCIGFVAVALSRQWDQAVDDLGDASIGWLALAVVSAAAGMTAIALPWKDVIERMGVDVLRRRAVAWYFVGEIGKYVPGGIWPIVGRAELARRHGVDRAAAYGSVALSLALLYLAAMVLVGVALPIVLASDASSRPLLVLLALPVGLLCLHHAVLARLVQLAERIFRRPIDVEIPSWGTSLALIVRYVPAWLCIGAATWAVARAFDPNAPFLDVAVAAVLSWIVGFVLVPVPGGIGVREATFVAAAASLAGGDAAVTAVVARLVFIAVDSTGALLSVALLRRRENLTSTESRRPLGSDPSSPRSPRSSGPS